jgi:hypothetical protein
VADRFVVIAWYVDDVGSFAALRRIFWTTSRASDANTIGGAIASRR